MNKTALILMLLTVLAKTLGLFRDITLSYFYGASFVSDAYLISIIIPTTIFSFIGVGLVTTFIPLFNIIETERGKTYANEFTSNVLNIVNLIFTFFLILILVYTESFVSLFASGFEDETLNLTIRFTEITIFSIYISSAVSIFKGYLEVNNSFVVPSLMGLPLNLLIIISIVLSSRYNVILLPQGHIVAMLFQLIFILPFVYKKGFRYTKVFDYRNKYILKMLKLAIPVILGVSVNQINVLVDKSIASQLAIGGVSALNYANKLNLFIQGIFVISLATVMYPTISRLAAKGDLENLKRSVSDVIGSVVLLIIPVSVGAMFFAEPIILLLFGRGAFNSSAVNMTSNALFYYSIGMIGFAIREIVSKVFYSLQDTRTPMINAGIGMGLNILLNIILSRYIGIGGLALATSISALFTSILMIISMRRKIGSFGMKKISVAFVKILFSSLAMAGISKITFNYLKISLSENISLSISILLGGILYVLFIYILGVEEVKVLKSYIKNKFKKS